MTDHVVRAELMSRIFVVLVLTIGGLSLAVTTFLAFEDHHRIKQNQAIQLFIKQQSIQNGQTAHAIEDCTQPGGDCYQRSQRQTAGAVADINRVVILAAACASGLPPGMSVDNRQARISSCVINRLAERSRP